jgi:Gpi18-like mannosyltransferase
VRRRAIPIWGAALLIFVASRIWSTALFVLTFLDAKNRALTFGSQRGAANLETFFGSWDASFYRHIARLGYRTMLPMAHGHVVPNEWAFLPVFPLLVRGVMALTTLDADASGVMVSVLAGAAAAVILARLMEPRVGRRRALWVAAAFAFGPLAFILQLPYAEGLFCLLVFAALTALYRRRYALVSVFGVIAAFTRPGELALPLALGILFLVKLREPSAFPFSERIRMIAAGIVTAAAGLLWPLIAGLATGIPDAYLRTEQSWWTGFVGRPKFVPFTPWFLIATHWLGPFGVVAVILVIGGAAVWLVRHRRSEVGAPVIAFAASYSLYLFAVFLPQQSIFRLVLPLTPLLGDASFSRTRRRRTILLASGAVLQAPAIWLLWFAGYP